MTTQMMMAITNPPANQMATDSTRVGRFAIFAIGLGVYPQLEQFECYVRLPASEIAEAGVRVGSRENPLGRCAEFFEQS